MNKNKVGGRGGGGHDGGRGNYGGRGGRGNYGSRGGGRGGYQERSSSYHNNNNSYQNYNQNTNYPQQNTNYHGQHYPPQQQQQEESYAAMQLQPDPRQGTSNPRNGFHHYNACESNFDNAQQGNGRPSRW